MRYLLRGEKGGLEEAHARALSFSPIARRCAGGRSTRQSSTSTARSAKTVAGTAPGASASPVGLFHFISLSRFSRPLQTNLTFSLTCPLHLDLDFDHISLAQTPLTSRSSRSLTPARRTPTRTPFGGRARSCSKSRWLTEAGARHTWCGRFPLALNVSRLKSSRLLTKVNSRVFVLRTWLAADPVVRPWRLLPALDCTGRPDRLGPPLPHLSSLPSQGADRARRQAPHGPPAGRTLTSLYLLRRC